MRGPDIAPSDRELMTIALDRAGDAYRRGEVPVGAVLLTPSGTVISDGNRTRELSSPSAHAEHLVISAAVRSKNDWRLSGCTLVSTLEPCLMCAGLAVLARVQRIVYGAWDKRFGAFGSVTDVLSMPGLNHYPSVQGGCMADESSLLLKRFFREYGRHSPLDSV